MMSQMKVLEEENRWLKAQGETLQDATVTACRLQFCPILMTSLAFTMGVVPMATGASAASQNAIGINVGGGMISATVLG